MQILKSITYRNEKGIRQDWLRLKSGYYLFHLCRRDKAFDRCKQAQDSKDRKHLCTSICKTL